MVVGIADAEEYGINSSDFKVNGEGAGEGSGSRASAKEELQKVADHIGELYPQILVHQLLLMDCPTDKAKDLVPEGAMSVPVQKTSTSTAMKTIMCDMSAKFLSELTTYAKAVQALPSVQSPGTSGRPALDRPVSMLARRNSSAPSTKSSPSDALSRTMSMSASTAAGLADSRSTSPQTGSIKPPTSFDEMTATVTPANNLARSVSRTEGVRTSSKDRMSLAFGSSSATEKAKNKGKARVGIVIGNLHMMAGRWSDAWQELVENTNKSRVASDYLWYAKGLESILVCMLLFVWTGYDFHIPAICYSGLERTSALHLPSGTKDGIPTLGLQDPEAAEESAQRFAKALPDLVMIILGIHERGSSLGGETLPPVAYSESIIRLAKLLAILQNANGQLDSAIIRKMISSKASATQSKPNVGYTTALSKHAIADVLFRAYPPPVAAVPLSDNSKILAAIASVLGMLGLERKRAIVMKELVASLVPALVQARKVGAAEMGVHPAASLSAAFDVSASDQQSGLDGLLKDIHLTYGARDSDRPFEGVKDINAVNGDSIIEPLIDATIRAATNFADIQVFGSLRLKVDILRACIDLCEALPDLPGVVYFAALLLRIAGPQSAVAPGKSGGRVKLATEEQIRLISNMSRTINAASKVGLKDIQVPYWDDFLVRNLQWLDIDRNDVLREHHKSAIDVEALSRKRTPFLYDPFAKHDKGMEEKIMVADESAELILTLQNPYDFEIKVEKIAFATEGVSLEVQQPSFMLGPARVQNVPVIVQAKDVGKLKIVGCSIKFAGCREQVFPIYQDAWLAEVPTKVKELGLHGAAKGTPHPVPDRIKSHPTIHPVSHSLSSTVIRAQPHVVVEATSLSESALMVLEGQRKTFQVTLRNTSSTIAVDFLHVSFEDSLTTSIRSALASKDLPRAEMYELELQLAKDPIFTWARSDSDSAEIISPGENATFDITVVGRPGLGAAKVLFDFAYLGQPFSELQGRAYTRQIFVPVDITVNASVQLHRIDFAEFPPDFAWSNQHRERLESRRSSLHRSSSRPPEKSSDRFRTLLDRVGRGAYDQEHCLVLLDLRNAWPNPLTVSVEVRENLGSPSSSPGRDEKREEEGWKRAYTVHEVIHPGHIARLVLLLPKIQITNPHAPIPLLSQNMRQFIVTADSMFNAESERTTREQFWFREEVLKYVRGSWKEDGTARQGSVDLRGIRLAPRMIDMLRLQDVDVSMTVVAANSGEDNVTTSPVKQLGRSSFQVQPESFLTLRTRILNRSTVPIRGLLRLQPTLAHQLIPDLALDIGRKFMVSGLLQQALPTIQPSESVTVEVGMCPLVSGDFDVHALVEELVLPDHERAENRIRELRELHSAKVEDFSAAGQGIKPNERRIWRSGEACRLIVSG